MTLLRGRVAVVTGRASGIGLACAELLAKRDHGWLVAGSRMQFGGLRQAR